jgi:succinate dehydrogenase/fumarate reductase flavoprotein subunit
MKVLKTDVLIIGGGSAGCLAAIAAKDADPGLGVTIFEKANIKRSGTLATGMDALNIVAVPGISTPEDYVKRVDRDLLHGVIDEELQYLLAEKSFALLKKLEQWGIEFEKDEEGKYVVKDLFSAGGKFLVPMDGWNLKLILAREVRSRKIKVLNRTMATSLISDFKSVHGATGLNVRTGEFIVCSAKATILANGGCSRFGLPTSGYLFGTFDFPGNAGDGYAMAYRAGADLAGFEFVQYWIETKELNTPLGKYYLDELSEKYLDASGNEIPDPDDPEYLVRLLLSGGGPVYVKFSHLPRETIRKIEQIMFSSERKLSILSFFKERGLDIRKDLIEYDFEDFCLCGGHGASGVKIDSNARASLQGLYAAGDVAYVPWQMLTGAFVFGDIAGQSAANYAKTRGAPEINWDFVRKEEKRVFSPMNRSHGIKPGIFEFKLRRVITQYLAPPRNEAKLKTALQWIRRFKTEDMNRLKTDDWHELGRAIETGFILDCAEMNARSALERKETRWGEMGGHCRSDFPERDDENWLKHVLVRIDPETGEMTVLTSPVKRKITAEV